MHMPKSKSLKSKFARKSKRRPEGWNVINQNVDNFSNFSKEAGALGKKLGEKSRGFKERAEKNGCECRKDCRWPLGVFSIIFSVILGVAGLAVCVWALDFLAKKTGSVLILALYGFFAENFALFLLIFLLSAAIAYCRMSGRRAYLALSPVSAALGITVFLWLASNMLYIANISLASGAISAVAEYIAGHLFRIFFFVLIAGYFLVLARLFFGKADEEICCGTAKQPEKARETGNPASDNAGWHEGAEIKRLYRSGKDRVLGGVCGGIAEYLGVDPVFVRLVWAAAVVFYGTGILLYIIAWIIIPRNPNHEWKD